MVSCQCIIFFLQTYKRRALSCCHPTPPFSFQTATEATHCLLSMLLAKVTYSVSASSSLTVSHQPLHRNCTCCLPLSLLPGATTHLPKHKAFGNQVLGMPTPIWKLQPRSEFCKPKPMSGPLLQLSTALSQRTHLQGRHLALHKGWKDKWKTPSKTVHAKDCIQSTKLRKTVSMIHNSHGEGRQQIAGWMEVKRIQKF